MSVPYSAYQAAYYAKNPESKSIKDISNKALDARISQIIKILEEQGVEVSDNSALENRIAALEARCARLEADLARNFEADARTSAELTSTVTGTSEVLDQILGE